jgi:hypothetical protein
MLPDVRSYNRNQIYSNTPAQKNQPDDKISKIVNAVKVYIEKAWVEMYMLSGGFILPGMVNGIILAYGEFLCPIAIGAATGVSLARSHEFFQNPSNRVLKIAVVALGILTAYHAPLFFWPAFLIYVHFSGTEPMQKFTREYFGDSSISISEKDYVIDADDEKTFAKEDYATFIKTIKNSETYRSFDEAKIALLEVRVIAATVNFFSEIKNKVYSCCPPIKRLFHPIDLIYTCMDPQTRTTCGVFSRTFTQVKFMLRDPVVVATALLGTAFLTYQSIYLWGPVATGCYLATARDVFKNGSWLGRLSFVAITGLALYVFPLYTVISGVFAAAFTYVPALAKARECMFNDILAKDIQEFLDAGRLPKRGTTTLRTRPKPPALSLNVFHFTKLWDKAFEEQNALIKKWCWERTPESMQKWLTAPLGGAIPPTGQ